MNGALNEKNDDDNPRYLTILHAEYLLPCVSDSAIVWLMVSLEIYVVCQNQITSRLVSNIQRIYWKEHPSRHHINAEHHSPKGAFTATDWNVSSKINH